MSNNVKSGLGWATIGSYAMYDLVKNNAELDAEIMAQCKQSILDDADYILDKGGSAGYFMSLLTDYPWGSNMTVANNGMILLMAEKITGDSNYGSFAKKQLDYLLGANSVGYCFVTGYGTVSPENPHHRPSEVVGSAMAGMLVGGPDSALEDSYAKAVLYESSPAQCYVDNVQSYSCNEVTIYWNSPLIYLLTAFQ
jgi:endoglucanase